MAHHVLRHFEAAEKVITVRELPDTQPSTAGVGVSVVTRLASPSELPDGVRARFVVDVLLPDGSIETTFCTTHEGMLLASLRANQAVSPVLFWEIWLKDTASPADLKELATVLIVWQGKKDADPGSLPRVWIDPGHVADLAGGEPPRGRTIDLAARLGGGPGALTLARKMSGPESKRRSILVALDFGDNTPTIADISRLFDEHVPPMAAVDHIVPQAPWDLPPEGNEPSSQSQ